jgi:hypothetical protein
MKLAWRIRLSTWLLLVLIMGLLLGLFFQKRRESQLQTTLLLYRDSRTEAVYGILDRQVALTYAELAPLEQALKDIKRCTTGWPKLPAGIPIYVDPIGLQETRRSMTSTVRRPPLEKGLTLREHLAYILKPLGLGFSVKDGFLMITSEDAVDDLLDEDPYLGYRDVLW